MKQNILVLIFLFYGIPTNAVVKSIDELQLLNKTLEKRELYTKEKVEKIENSKKSLKEFKKSDLVQFELQKQIALQYLDFQIDSALVYANHVIESAQLLNNQIQTTEAKLLKVDVLIHSGLYNESIDLLQTIDTTAISRNKKKQYYSLNALLYRYLKSYVGKGQSAKGYNNLRKKYQDSTFAFTRVEEESYLFLKAEIDDNEERLEEAKKTLLNDLQNKSINDRTYGPRAYRLANIYLSLNDTTQTLKYLALSSTSDLTHGVKEHASLRELSLLLFELGEIEQANTYMKIALEDALFAGARIRSYEILQIFPLINSAYSNLKVESDRRRTIMLVILSLLFVVLIFSLHSSKRKGRQLENANSEIKTIFSQLIEANKKLKQYSADKEEINNKLEASVTLQEIYIAKYLKLCSGYIGKIDEYRKMLYKKKKAGAKSEEMIKLLKSKEVIEEELRTFYVDFDKAFLTLYPNFVAQFNSLLKPEEQITIKGEERLNTELRIFALIRLGITESPQIAEFLRYSLTTIYNYRTRIRNKALGERDLFEQKVRGIHKV